MIQIVCGVYGHYIKGCVVPKDKNSKPFELTPEQEARLVRLGVAKYVEQQADDTKSDASNDLPILPDGVEAIPEYSVDMKADELRKIAKLMGLTFPVGTTKAEMVAQMDAFLDEHMEDDDAGDDDDADMPEDDGDDDDMPDFDPTEAVQ